MDQILLISTLICQRLCKSFDRNKLLIIIYLRLYFNNSLYPSLSAENESLNKKVLDYQLVKDFFFYTIQHQVSIFDVIIWAQRKKSVVLHFQCHRHTSCNNSARALRRVPRECTARRESPIPHYQSQLEVSIIVNGVRRYVHLDRKVKAADFNVFHYSVVVSVRG